MERSITERIDPAELAAGWKAMDELHPLMHVRVRVGAKTDLGSVRENNEDKYDLLEPEEPGVLATKGRLYGVADGMGGHSAGQIASELALKTLIRSYFSDPSPQIETSLREAVQEANNVIFEGAQVLPERQGMGTTLTAAVLREEKLHFVHVGDSRAYIVRHGVIRQITSDHSWVAEQVRMGGMSVEDALASPFRNIILRSVGTGQTIEPDFYEEFVQSGDVFVLCSDGLTAHVNEEEIAARVGPDVITKIGPSVAALRLVELANERGGRDNITVIIIVVDAVEPYD